MLRKVSLLRITDGDTVTVQEGAGLLSWLRKPTPVILRLYGIDAPESNQPGGAEATRHLKRLIGRKRTIRAQYLDNDQYGRTVSILYPNKYRPKCPSRPDLVQSYNYRMVQDGHAHCYLPRPADRQLFQSAEQYARDNHHGLWRHRRNQEQPSTFRRLHRARRIRLNRIKLVLLLLAAPVILTAIYIATVALD